MPRQDTVLSALLKAVPRAQLAQLVAQHRSDKGVRKLTSWSQLVALLVVQLAGCRSLREVEALLASQSDALHQLGSGRVCRSTLAVANATRPVELFADLLTLLLTRLMARTPPAVSREAVRLVDATSIRLHQDLHGWARRSVEHAGVKLHLVYDPRAMLPVYFTITPCRINDIVEAEKLPLEPGSIYVFDKGYYDFAFWADLDAAGCCFVTRLKHNSPTRLVEERAADGETILADRLVRLSERLMGQRRNPYQGVLREVLVARPDGEPLRLVSNDLSCPAERIAQLYKTRWQIELHFKWLKQNLRIKHFLGTSANAVKAQIITALIAYLLLHYAHRLTFGRTSAQRLRQLVRASLWQCRSLADIVPAPPRSWRAAPASLPPALVLP
jgi:hypothetical protein